MPAASDAKGAILGDLRSGEPLAVGNLRKADEHVQFSDRLGEAGQLWRMPVDFIEQTLEELLFPTIARDSAVRTRSSYSLRSGVMYRSAFFRVCFLTNIAGTRSELAWVTSM